MDPKKNLLGPLRYLFWSTTAQTVLVTGQWNLNQTGGDVISLVLASCFTAPFASFYRPV